MLFLWSEELCKYLRISFSIYFHFFFQLKIWCMNLIDEKSGSFKQKKKKIFCVEIELCFKKNILNNHRKENRRKKSCLLIKIRVSILNINSGWETTKLRKNPLNFIFNFSEVICLDEKNWNTIEVRAVNIISFVLW